MINNTIPRPRMKWNNFPLHYSYDTSGRFGNLIPVQVTEVAPGDFFNENVEFNIRLAPLSAPAMVRLNVHFHAFYVPYRILTPRSGQETTWEKFIGSIGKPKEEILELPKLLAHNVIPLDDVDESIGRTEISTGSLWDYLQLPVYTKEDAQNDRELSFGCNDGFDDAISLLPHLAYLKIWNDWFRRDQIEPEVVFPLDMGRVIFDQLTGSEYSVPEDTQTGSWLGFPAFMHELFKLRVKNYERDYFTSGLPEPQYGEDVTIGNSTDVYAAAGASLSLRGFEIASADLSAVPAANISVFHDDDPREFVDLAGLRFGANGLIEGYEGARTRFSIDNADAMGDIEEVSGLTVTPSISMNELRMAMQLQGVRERINRGGTRYVEIMQNIYGVSINDLRLMRPQFLGAVKAPITIGAVLQTSESNHTPQGTMTGQGGSVGGNFLFRNKCMFDEHGLIMVLMSITPRTGYTGGVRRLFRKFDPLDYYCPMFDHLGEQMTMTSELYDRLDGEVTGEEFAYNPRYQEYKSNYSTCTGEFRNTLDNWNVVRSFDNKPTLSPDFIHADAADMDRIFAYWNIQDTSNEQFYAQVYFDIKAKRNMSKYSTPFTFF